MQERLAAFMDECVYPAEAAYDRSRATSLDPHHVPPVVEDLKVEALKYKLTTPRNTGNPAGPGVGAFYGISGSRRRGASVG